MHQFQFAGYYMARERGYYREAGLEVDIIEGGPHALEPANDVLSSKVDFAISNSGVVIRRMEGDPVVALAAIAQTSPIVWIVRADSGIHSPLDLDGKRLMLMPPPESAELLAMLRQEGIDINQLDLVETTLDLEDLIEGRVDAYDGYITNEPWYLEKMGLDYRLIRPRDYGVNFYNDVLITRESMIRNHPAAVEAFVDASLRGWVYALDNIEETVQLIHEKYATNKSLEHLMYEAEHFRALVMPDLVALGHMNPARWQTIAETYRAFDMVDGAVELEGFIYQGSEPADLAWLYRVVTVTLVVIGLLGLIAFYFARMNRKLVREAQRRKRVEEKLRAKQQELYRLASTDPLTGLWNRLKFEEIAAGEIRRAERYGYPLSIIFLDLDHFKQINDQHGHAYGDRALTEVARLINRNLRDSDCVCRWGGEEFLILVPHLDLEATAGVAEKLRETIARCDLQTGVGMSVSLGIATLSAGEGLEDLIRKADEALYEAKAKGRNRVERAD
jgi:diguanylate cyclase (GGDEF)-like protein